MSRSAGNDRDGKSSAVRILDRLVGLETEYAIRVRPDVAGSDVPSHFDLYTKLIDELRRTLPAVRASHAKTGYFFATGGSVWYEKIAYAPTALIEGATPECRGPRRVLTWQRAQDALLSLAARSIDAGGEFTLLKSDSDAWGHVYGAQENYEATIATATAWTLWRIGRLLLIPLVALGWALALAALMLVLVYYVIALPLWIVLWPVRADLRRRRRFGAIAKLRSALIGDARGLLGDAQNLALPPLLAPVVRVAEHLAATPAGFAMLGLAHVAAFRNTRRKLLPFLVSRAIFTGAGRLDERGHFHIASKAGGINRTIGLGGFYGDHPVFSFGHFFKDIFILWTLPRARGSARNPRQRLQVSSGDSNLCEEAEYLRIGATTLVLDAIEAGEFDDAPALKRPIDALRTIAADPSLSARVKFADRTEKTALQIQRDYLRRCRRLLARRADAPAEAFEIVRRWEEVLGLLETDQEQLIGRVDWVTKRFLLDRCGADAPAEARKKIDLRYHELSPDGYFQLLAQAGLPKRILSDEEIDAASQGPPPDSPATVRGRYVREFAAREDARANWHTVTLGYPTPTRVIDLTKYPRGKEALNLRG